MVFKRNDNNLDYCRCCQWFSGVLNDVCTVVDYLPSYLSLIKTDQYDISFNAQEPVSIHKKGAQFNFSRL